MTVAVILLGILELVRRMIANCGNDNDKMLTTFIKMIRNNSNNKGKKKKDEEEMKKDK